MSKTNETVAAISMDQKLKVKEIENIYTYLKYIKEMLPSGLKKTIEISLTIVYMTIGTVRIVSGISMKRDNLVLFRKAQRKT